jgi:hypothetical protein
MSSEHVNRVICAAQPTGSAGEIERLLAAADEHNVDAVAVLGDLGERGDGYRAVFRALGHSTRPVFWVPGGGDVPLERYLHEAFNIETAFPLLHGVHGTAAYASGEVLFAGFGGEISDDLHQPRDEQEKLSYPRWEAEYRLKVLGEFDYNQLVLLFWTAPAHKGLHRPGSDVVAELIGTYRPRLVVSGGERGVEELGRSVIVAPGSLGDGHFALVDLHKRTAELEEFTLARR